jgi:hypothetical protein
VERPSERWPVGASVKRRYSLAIVLPCIAAALAGCGTSSTASRTAEAHLAAVANAVCREFHTNRATGAPFEVHMKAEFARVRALMSRIIGIPQSCS